MKTGIIGCGVIAAAHVRWLKHFYPAVELCLCDKELERARGLAEMAQTTRVYSSYHELLEREQPLAVHVTTPPDNHFEVCQTALGRACHVFVEKPAVNTTAEWAELSSLARARDRLLYVDYSTVGMPVVQQALATVKSGELGRLISVYCHYGASWPRGAIPYGNAQHWAYSLPGGVLRNWLDHPASLVLSAIQEPSEVRVCLARRNFLPQDSPDLLEAVVRNDSQMGAFTLSLGHSTAEIRALFFLEGGTITLDARRMLMSVIKGRGQLSHLKRTLTGVQEGWSLIRGTFGNLYQIARGRLRKEPGIGFLIRNFHDSIQGQAEPVVTDALGRGVSRLHEALCAAAQVPLEDAATPAGPRDVTNPSAL